MKPRSAGYLYVNATAAMCEPVVGDRARTTTQIGSSISARRARVPDAMDRATAWLNDSGRKSLLSDIGVGTIDQAMIAVMYARYSTLRLAGLAAKTLIIDEVHAYDVYMKQILEVLIELNAKSSGSVILLSATLPLKHRRDYANAWNRGRRLVLSSWLAPPQTGAFGPRPMLRWNAATT